jgi:hypothetical protein
MTSRMVLAPGFAGALVVGMALAPPLPACCPAPPAGKPVVNADQTVIILWDAATKTQHFIRKASFLSEAQDFGFVVPSPTEPELEESGDGAFPYLHELTKPQVKRVWRPVSIGCGATATLGDAPCAGGVHAVNVLQEKEVAGFHAVVLQTHSSLALVTWLREHGYAFSPEVQEWARPYVEGGWKFTALKIAREGSARDRGVATTALRISFKTERPLFPYREPDPKTAAQALGAKQRLLRIYFLAEAIYRGELTRETPWTGQAAWAGKLAPQARRKLLELLRLPPSTGPASLWLTEFEDYWPYQAAPADLYFARDPDQRPLRREPIIQYVSAGWPHDASLYAIAAALVLPPVLRRMRRRGSRHG